MLDCEYVIQARSVKLQPVVTLEGSREGEKLPKYCDMGKLSVDFNVICTVFQGFWQPTVA